MDEDFKKIISRYYNNDLRYLKIKNHPLMTKSKKHKQSDSGTDPDGKNGENTSSSKCEDKPESAPLKIVLIDSDGDDERDFRPVTKTKKVCVCGKEGGG